MIQTIGDTRKPFIISQSILLEAYQRVQLNRGSVGVDGMSLDELKQIVENTSIDYGIG